MPFAEVNIKQIIEQKRNADPEFREILDNRRMEYEVLEQLIKLRKEQGLTQKELAEKTGKKQQIISKMETNEKSPTLSTLCQLAQALDVDIKLVPRQSPQIHV
jgi:DNA-binding XRE family transcriptional regulator